MQFSSFIDIDTELMTAAATAVQDSLQLKAGERALIIANPYKDSASIAMALHDAIIKVDAEPILIYQKKKSQLDFADPAVIAAIKSVPDIVLSISTEKLGKDHQGMLTPYELNGEKFRHIYHYYMHGTKQLRSFWSPSVTIETFKRAVSIDYAKLKDDCSRIKKIFDEGISVRVLSAKGTNITFSIDERKGMLDDGDFSVGGSGGNIPAGETYVSPVVDSAEGVIVFDGSIASHDGVIVINEPIRVEFHAGYIADISGGTEAGELMKTIQLGESQALKMEAEGQLPKGMGSVYKKNARALGELGIGLNRKAHIIGNMLEDEKVYKSCHFAIGQNYDGDGPALIHLDGLVKNPTVLVYMKDGREVVVSENGELML